VSYVKITVVLCQIVYTNNIKDLVFSLPWQKVVISVVSKTTQLPVKLLNFCGQRRWCIFF
jgi:hypothetical protein